MNSSSTESPVVVEPSSIDDLKAICKDDSKTLFAILDACDEPRVPQKVHELGNEKAISLYQGAAHRDYWSIAPYLVIVDEELLNWIVEKLLDDPWGIFAETPSDISLDQLRKHFRNFLLVKSPSGEEMYFRFYDPRVIRVFLDKCLPKEIDQFFGSVASYCIEDEKSKGLVRIFSEQNDMRPAIP